MSSTRTGQGSLRPLPAPNALFASLASYNVPADLKAERKSLSGSKAGIEVYKVAKVRCKNANLPVLVVERSLTHISPLHFVQNGKLVARRVALSSDNRNILVTSNKIKSIRGLFKALAPQSQEVTSRSIDLSCVERIERGQQTNRFIAARYVTAWQMLLRL
jgi:hypothetical protein